MRAQTRPPPLFERHFAGVWLSRATRPRRPARKAPRYAHAMFRKRSARCYAPQSRAAPALMLSERRVHAANTREPFGYCFEEL